ncbi:MAG TPA: hypothetical protein VHL11_05000, partial [Phototrophicaceae bacterium]|nr:hypothetical protein [Phototrophicaceae bacterium]
GLPAYTTTYTAQTEDGAPVYGTLVGVLNEATGATVVFTLESSTDDAQVSGAVLDVLNNTLTLFAPPEE